MSDPVTVAVDTKQGDGQDAVQPSPSVVPAESQTEKITSTTQAATETNVTSRTLGCQKLPLKAFCGLARCSTTTNLQDCSACKEIRYCGKEHQTEHFKEGHKLVCQGRAKGAPLKFQECVDKASSYFERKMWGAALPYYAAILELTERGLGVFHPLGSPAVSVIGWAGKIPGKRQDRIMNRCRHGLIAADALDLHQVGISALVTCIPEFVMDIDHQMMGGCFTNRLVIPCLPKLTANIHKAVFNALHSPFFVERQDVIELPFHGDMIDVENDSDVLTVGVVDDLVEV